MTDLPGSAYILGTSAIFALLEDEPRAQRVEELLCTAHVFLPFVIGLKTY